MRNVTALLIAIPLFGATGSALAQGDAKRGEYIAIAAGCIGCHTAEKGGKPFAGGRALKTPFGTFRGPNITPHPDAGIGKWTEADFARALRQGVRPDGAPYFPAFPYPSYSGMTDADVRDLWVYLRTLPADARPSEAHELSFPYGWRFLVRFWKLLYFSPAPPAAAGAASPAGRGEYLTRVLGHCGECHTPRNSLGAPRHDRYLAGGKAPDGKNVPNLTPTRLKKWSDAELKDFLVTGLTPDGDAPAAAMAEVIENTTSKLRPDDLAAMIAYLRTLPPLPEEGR